MPTLPFTEKSLSQIPALMQFINMGYRYLTPQQALAERGNRLSNVLLENILREQLKRINRIHRNGEEHQFTEENINAAIERIKHIHYDGLLATNQKIYDMITLGISLQQNIDGTLRSHTLNYIDWKNPANNVFHAVAEFSVERASGETVRPDIVLFVNGIPLVVIECKAPGVDVDSAVSQNIRNQGDDYIPGLFIFAQILLAVNKNAAKYATVGSDKIFWSLWRERDDSDDEVGACINKPLDREQKDMLFSGEFASTRAHFEALERDGGRTITEQDKCIFSLCRPERLLEIVYGYTLFDSHQKKIARYQQFFVVRETIKRIKQTGDNGSRRGGLIWHTQGSGKSITMVMLVRALLLDSELNHPRIILVTDRKDLDRQLGNTFKACGLDRLRATSGRDLVRHIKDKAGIVTTVINKFEKAFTAEKHVDDSPNIVVLVDEGHRTQYGTLATGMRRMLPNAYYIGFTGTPLFKDDKNSFAQFGTMIEPHYSMRQAVADNAVVPLLYEGRHVEMRQDQEEVDAWFAIHTDDLTAKQKADLKRKYSHMPMLNQTEQVVYRRAFDISGHYRKNWQGTGFKAQLVAPDKATALKYRQNLKHFGMVSSEVIISAPDSREGHEKVGTGPTDEVAKFWQQMMEKYGREERYNNSIINCFRDSDEPEILIVVDKLLTGFDAPRNTVLYLCRPLREHTLLQAIARVNRLHEGKEFGYIIDYAHVLEELDTALNAYDALAKFDESDIEDFLISVNAQIEKLPQQYSDLWNLFNTVKNSRDTDQYETLLADDSLRTDFYERLTAYSKTLAIALSSEKFMREVDDEKLQRYRGDLKRFQKLKAAVNLRYSDAINYRDYEPRIKKLLDMHIHAEDVTQLYQPVNIFDQRALSKIMEGKGVYANKTTAAKADIIAHAVKRRIAEKMHEDPALYEKFSALIQTTIDNFRQGRISDADYLKRAGEIRDEISSGQRDDVPANIRSDSETCAYFGVIKACFNGTNENNIDDIAAETARFIKNAIEDEWKVDFWNDGDARNSVKRRVDDFFYDTLKDKYNIALSGQQMDKIFKDTMQVAKLWRRG